MADETTAILALKASTDKAFASVDRALSMLEKERERNQVLTDELIRQARANHDALFSENGVHVVTQPSAAPAAAPRSAFGTTLGAGNVRVPVHDDHLGGHSFDIPKS